MRIIRMISIADVFTLVNALMGFSAILLVTLDQYVFAVYAILFGILCDGLDGLVARRFSRKWYFGDYLDIMSDTTSFCVAPAVVMFRTVQKDLATLSAYSDYFLFAACASLVVCGLLRLARFCYQSGGGSSNFTGLPSPGSALPIALIVLQRSISSSPLPGFILVAVAVIMAVLMISDFRYPKVRGAYAIISGIVIFLVIVFNQLFGKGVIAEFLLDVALLLALAYVAGGPLVARRRGQDGQGKEALQVQRR